MMVRMMLRIDGMMCGMCESHINDTIRRSFAVKKVTSSHSRGTTEIIAESAIAEDALEGHRRNRLCARRCTDRAL